MAAEMDVAKGVNTAVAIANGSFDSSGSIAQSFVVSLVRSDGTLQGMAPVSLGAGEHVSKYLNENGLFFQSDSFIQAVLPADGTYYLVVTDAQGRGGQNGYYRLHAQFLSPGVQGDASRLEGPD